MKRLLLLPLLFLLWFPLSSASAHTVKTDGTVTALLHTDPDDNLTAGSPSRLLFDVRSTISTPFDLTKCDCQLTIREGSKTVYQAPLTPQDTEEAWLTFTFPDKANYQLTLRGTPKNGAQFRTFNLVYSVPVNQGINDGAFQRWLAKALDQLGDGAITALAPLLFIAWLIWDKTTAKKRTRGRGTAGPASA